MSKLKYRKLLGPSQMSTVLGLNPYQSLDELKNELENGYKPYENLAIKLGNERESIAIYFYQKLYNVTITKPKFVVDANNLRIGGICDGLIDDNIGLEVKCHMGKDPLYTLPDGFLVQMAAYMYLYKRSEWILMSCVFNKDHTVSKYKLFKVQWVDIKDKWENDWYPKLTNFVNNIHWKS